MTGLTGDHAGDSLRRVFVPREIEVRDGIKVFQTLDSQVYSRDKNGTIHRAVPKANGRTAKRQRAAQRRKEGM